MCTGDPETDSILADPVLMAAIREALADVEAGRVYTHAQVVAEQGFTE